MAVASELATARSGPWFGRGEIRDALQRALEGIRLGHGQGVLILGEGGVGKSVLLGHIRDAASSEGFRVLYGRALPSDLPQPFALTQDLLRSANPPKSRDGGSAASRPPGSPRGSGVLSLFLAPYQGLAGDPDGGDPDGARAAAEVLISSLAGPAGHVEESRIELFDRLSAYLLDLAKDEPILLVIDDLHLADEPSLEFLLQLVNQFPQIRIGFVATLPPSRQVAPRASPLIERLAHRPGVEQLTVRRMTQGESAEYAQWILHGREPSRDEVMRWYTQTDGNPLFLEYVVRGTMGVGGSSILSGPLDVDALLREQLKALPDADRRVLVHAAVLGKEFDFLTLLQAMEEMEEERLAEGIDRLVHRGLLREKGNEVYEFVSERIRADAYGQLTETRRRILHKKIARALEARARTDPATIFEMARQFYLARDDAPAIEYNRRAAEIAMRTYAYPTAVVHLERALECLGRVAPPDLGTELLTRIELGRLQDELADLQRGEEVLEEAIRRARGEPQYQTDLALALLWLARLRIHRSAYISARDLATEASGILEPIGHERGLLVAHRVLSVVSLRIGDLEEAERHCREAIRLADHVGDPYLRGHVIVDLANVIGPLGEARFDEALQLYAEAARLFADTGDYGARARVLMNEAVLFGNHNQPKEAVESNRQAIESAEKSRSRIWIGYTHMNHAQYLAEVHDPAAGRIALARAAEVLRPLGDLLTQQQILMIDGILCEEEGNLSGADEAFVESLKVSRESPGLVGETAEVLFRRARIAARQERPDDARQMLAEARAAGLETLRRSFAEEVAELDRQLGSAVS
ncbi:MAG: AAA family ATPase [Thermoplasmata archaeon]|nr:AAA family ATPase [Thermoplasmata archaeon]